jgi:predicted phage baseplate assembly protein
MSDEAWWGREVADGHPPPGQIGQQPQLLVVTAPAVRAQIQARIPTYTPDWRNPDRADAGVALVRLFGLLMEPVLRRANRLPEKALVEHLRTAGVQGRPPTVAAALLEFTVSAAAGRSIPVPAGFQAGASPATGEGDEVVFETARTLYATPLTIAAAAVEENGVLTQATLGAASFRPFGSRPQPGNALWVGLSTVAGVASPTPAVSIGVIAAGAVPAPAASLATGQPALAPQPLVVWQLLNGTHLQPADVVRDETSGLRRTGIVELATPPNWQQGRPPGGPGLSELLWLRARLVHGGYPAPPELLDVRANIVRATAARTIRDEPLEPVDTDPDGFTRMALSQTPVVAGSLVLEVEGDPLSDLFGTGTGDETPASRWREVDNLVAYGGSDRVYVLDPDSGVVTFGNGRHGAQVPDGFRNVRAVVYRAGGGAAGAVPAKAIGALLTAVGFVTGVTNPFPTSGGSDAEPAAETVRRGGLELRARDRAVAAPDYGVLARRTPGAQVARAHAVVGLHPDYPGRPIPGLVGVLIVPPADAAHTESGPPVPTSEELRAVADFLSGSAAPAGVEVVASAPRYHQVSVEARVVLDPTEDQADTLRRAVESLNTYLHPIRGGADGAGWPFGGPLRHAGLVHRLLSVTGVLATPQLAIVVDGRRRAPCMDTAISPQGLVWPARHELLPVERGGGP